MKGPRAGRRSATPDLEPVVRVRMTGKARREQLLDVGRTLFAEKGYEGTSIEEVAHRAGVSKPIVYEHFGGKEGPYAVVVDREMRLLLDHITSVLAGGRPRELLEQAALALLDYIQDSSDGFRILVRDSPVASASGTFSSLRGDIASHVEHILGREFALRGYDTALARAVQPVPGRHGRADRAVVAGGPRAAEGRGRGASGQPRLEWPLTPGTQPPAARGPLTALRVGPNGLTLRVTG